MPLVAEVHPGKRVTLVGGGDDDDSSPSPKQPIRRLPSVKQPIKGLFLDCEDDDRKPLRSSGLGLDCGDLDPFAQSDSFVYLAVSSPSPAPQVGVSHLL